MVRIDDSLQRRLLTLTAIQISMAILVIAAIAVGGILLPARWRALESENVSLRDRVTQLEERLAKRDEEAVRESAAARAEASRQEALAERVRLLSELIEMTGVDAYGDELRALLTDVAGAGRAPSAWRGETAIAVGRLHLLAGDPAGAALWCHAEAGTDWRADAALCRSEALLALGRIDEAYSVSESAIAVESPDPRAYLLRGRIELALNHPDRAHESLTRALASDRTAVDAAVLLIDQALIANDIDSVEPFMQRALTLAPAREDVQRLHARWLRRVGRYEDCVYVLKDIAATEGDVPMLETLAVCLLEANFPGEARVALRQLLEHRSEDARIHDWLGRAHAELMEYHFAEESFGNALVLDPDLAPAWFHLGVVRLNRDDLGNAQDALERAVALDADRAEAHFALAVCLARQGEGAKARLALQRALGVDESLMEQALAVDAFESILASSSGTP